jgi:hypothetical protein
MACTFLLFFLKSHLNAIVSILSNYKAKALNCFAVLPPKKVSE